PVGKPVVPGGPPAPCPTQLWLLLRRYGTVLARHYARESRYRHRLKEQIQRQAELAGITLGAEDVDVLADSPQGPRIVGRDLEELKAKHHLCVAQARQRQLLELEAQMLELRGLFVQLEELLAQQHGAADSVELHVLRTRDCAAQPGGGVRRGPLTPFLLAQGPCTPWMAAQGPHTPFLMTQGPLTPFLLAQGPCPPWMAAQGPVAPCTVME
uniref:Uncharacterized protein n=1 Tax=Taeniopygia guttata TaxID=59729 RepID=A0A674H449_TAEGU